MVKKILHGENPYQAPAYLVSKQKNIDPLAVGSFKQLSGELPCYTSLADLDCIINTIAKMSCAFKKNFKKIPFICIAAKHGNPCGSAIDWNNPDATIEKALWTDPLAIWGGEVITNFKIEKKQADLLFLSNKRKKMFGNAAWMLDVIASPEFSQEAVEILGKRPQRKLFKNPALTTPSLPKDKQIQRQVRGGFLKQPPPNYVLDLKEIDWLSKPLKNAKDIDSLIIAWAAAYTSNHGGNEVALAKNRQLIGIGGGPSTIEATRIAVSRAQNNNFNPINSVFVADAFFPYTDGPELLVKNKCKGGLVPAGGKNEPQVRKYFRSKNVLMGFIPEKYRGFCRH